MRRLGFASTVFVLRPVLLPALALFLTLVTTVLLTDAPALAQETAARYELGAGDRLRVTVYNHEDLSGEFSIDGSGDLSLPLIGQVSAGGLSVPELERAIVEKLKPDYLVNPRVSVEVLNFRPFYILGEVNDPGSYDYVDGMTVLNAVALAGGFTYRAREDDILIKRAGDPEGEKREVSPNALVLPGDVITVPERFF